MLLFFAAVTYYYTCVLLLRRLDRITARANFVLKNDGYFYILRVLGPAVACSVIALVVLQVHNVVH